MTFLSGGGHTPGMQSCKLEAPIVPILTIVSTVAGLIGQHQAHEAAQQNAEDAKVAREEALAAQQKKTEIEQRQASIERQRNIRRAIANQRMVQAQNMAALGGAVDSSMATGGTTSIGIDQATAIGSGATGLAAATNISNLQTQYNTAVTNMQNAMNRPIGSNMWSDMGQLFGAFANEQTMQNLQTAGSAIYDWATA